MGNYEATSAVNSDGKGRHATDGYSNAWWTVDRKARRFVVKLEIYLFIIFLARI